MKHPGHALDMIACESKRNRFPAEDIYGIWRTESGGRVYGEVGKLSVMDAYCIRERWKKNPYRLKNEDIAAGTACARRLMEDGGQPAPELPEGHEDKISIFFAPEGRICEYLMRPDKLGTDPDRDVSDYGNGTRNAWALCLMGAWNGFDAERLLGSPSKATLAYRVRNFGGCVGPMQITPSEWLADRPFRTKNPLELSWAIASTSFRLRKQYDGYRAEGYDHATARQKSISRYYGRDPGLKYFSKVNRHAGDFVQWDEDGVLRKNVTAIAARSAASVRKRYLALR